MRVFNKMIFINRYNKYHKRKAALDIKPIFTFIDKRCIRRQTQYYFSMSMRSGLITYLHIYVYVLLTCCKTIFARSSYKCTIISKALAQLVRGVYIGIYNSI